MTTFLQRHQTTLHLTLATTLGAITATTLIFTTLALRRRTLTSDLKASIPEINASHHATPLTEYGAAERRKSIHPSNYTAEEERSRRIAAKARRGEYDEELVLEQLSRNRLFLTDEGLKRLRDSVVVVVGLGGVGSHCIAALARSGVGRIRVVDFDQVTLSSLNRHALATLADVGTQKVMCVRKRLEQIVPWVRVDVKGEMMDKESQERLLGVWNFEDDAEGEGSGVDWVVDAIDNVDTKVELLRYCATRGLKVISAMGAGCKSDPTRVMVGELSQTFEDPLSSVTRRRLKIMGVTSGITCVFSTEKPGEGKAVLQPIDQKEVDKGDVGNLAVLGGFRTRILPVLGTMPAVFGYTAASHVICEIAEYPMEYRVGDRGRDKMYDGILASFQGLMERLVKKESSNATIGLRVPVTKEDVAYLIDEVFKGKSVVSGLSTRLSLVPWRKPEGGFAAHVKNQTKQKHITMNLTDLVLMTKEESQTHENHVLSGSELPEDYYDPDVVTRVKRRHHEEHEFDKYR